MLRHSPDPDFLSAGIRREAERLAGQPQSFSDRAAVYHHLYAHSFGDHVFPLLAAHGSLWASSYLKRKTRAAELSGWQHLRSARKLRVQALDRLGQLIGEIDRLTFVETYYFYRLTEHANTCGIARSALPARVADRLEQCHVARRAREKLSDEQRARLFESFLRWQQEEVIGPVLASAPEPLDWLLINRSGLPPLIRLPYFPRAEALSLAGTIDIEAQIGQGLRAFRIAEQVGWDKVENILVGSKLVPKPFQRNSGEHFFRVQNRARSILRQEFLAAC